MSQSQPAPVPGGRSIAAHLVACIEAGKTVNITSRRALAKALGYDNPDVFDDPKFAEEVLNFFDGLKAIRQKNLDDQHPDSVRVKAQPLASGTEAMRFADVVNAMSFVIDDGLSEAAKEVAAGFCDHVQELMDLDDFPMSGRLGITKDLDDLLQDLREKAAHAYFATRDRKLRGPDWGDKPSWEATIGFLVVVPTDRQLNELYIPRKSRFA